APPHDMCAGEGDSLRWGAAPPVGTWLKPMWGGPPACAAADTRKKAPAGSTKRMAKRAPDTALESRRNFSLRDMRNPTSLTKTHAAALTVKINRFTLHLSMRKFCSDNRDHLRDALRDDPLSGIF